MKPWKSWTLAFWWVLRKPSASHAVSRHAHRSNVRIIELVLFLDGLNRSTQHFISNEEDGVLFWLYVKDIVEVFWKRLANGVNAADVVTDQLGLALRRAWPVRNANVTAISLEAALQLMA
jgi:hypothetical protein